MAAYAKTKIFYISVGFWLIIGVESYNGWSNHRLTIQAGGSFTIPCHYDEEYKQQKKYWFSEIDEIYKNTTEGNLSIIDYPDQSLFTVSMRNLQNEDTGPYDCVVDIEEIPTVTYELYIKVQSAPDVSVVDSSVSGHEGGDISVQCLYSSGHQNEVKRWCRYKDQSCYTVGRSNTSQSSSVQISDDGRSSFSVLMTGLRLTDSGWYFCFVGQALNPVHLTVTEAKPDKEKDIDDELLTVWLQGSAVLLLLLILVGVFIWRWRQRPKQDQHQIRKGNNSTAIDRIYSKPEDHVIYSTVNDENPDNPNKDIIYSIIDNVPGSEVMKSPAGGAIYSIIYSTVGPH
ncbi:polymeric immunoglobulin receptor-like [Onychostoma macrolepis]|uniref:polymeric immunoglobulin receptor-like n=1 Tax=Onychostoma macrolepis TaxID=369639 RepID=UPI00272D0549|nr:polymeric immunoglobulin receptor-like [Onychostoma macrolepis]